MMRTSSPSNGILNPLSVEKEAVLNGLDHIDKFKRYSSSDVVVAAEELKFRQAEKKKVIESKVKSGKMSKQKADSELKKAYHTMAQTYKLVDLGKEFDSDVEKGLTSAMAAKKLTEYGLNELTPPKHDPWWLRLLKSIFGGFFNVLLWFGSILCFIAYIIDNSDIPDPSNVECALSIFSLFYESQIHSTDSRIEMAAMLMGSMMRWMMRRMRKRTGTT